MKTKRNNPFPDETGHTVKNGVVVGESGSGSSRLILARSGVSQLKCVYGAMSPGGLDRLLRAIKANNPFRMNLKK
ncbi:hypothetical protein AB2523_25910 [Klebsiella michiganensis]|uniref:hypothetical protein n=1 Tax=Klebsiella michiganensis TaxID=1134687 RepID=UPI0034638547